MAQQKSTKAQTCGVVQIKGSAKHVERLPDLLIFPFVLSLALFSLIDGGDHQIFYGVVHAGYKSARVFCLPLSAK
jgi:hypothetical protein